MRSIGSGNSSSFNMKSFGSAADFRFILFIGSILFLLHIAHNKAGSNSVIINSTLSNTTTKKDNALVNSISLNDLHLQMDNVVAVDDVDSTNSSDTTPNSIELDESISSSEKQQKQQNLTQNIRYNNNSIAADTTNTDNPRRSANPDNTSNNGNLSIPIYLISDESGLISALDYKYLAPIWDRNTTYDNILQQAQSKPYHFTDKLSNVTARESLQDKLEQHNVTVIFHTSPKTASSTLRDACMKTQLETCGIKPRGSSKWPDGYRTPKRLTQLFSQCPNTYHFCVKGPVAITKNFTRFESPRLCCFIL